MTGRRAVVTGGAGFIGSHLVEALAARGERVTIVDDLSVGTRENLGALLSDRRIELVQADVRDRSSTHAALVGAEIVFHLATRDVRLSLIDPELVNEVNATGTLNVLTGAVAANVRRFVYVSSSEVYGTAQTVPMREDHPFDPTTVYGASKLVGELYARAFQRTHGLPITIVRPFNTYGPRAPFAGIRGEVIPRFVLKVLRGERPTVFGAGDQTRDFTHVDDTVRGMLLAADSDAMVGQAINVARGREIEIVEIARLVAAACCRPDLTPEHLPDRPADVKRHFADVSLAHRVLGFEPRTDVADGIAQYVAWFRATYPEPARLLAGDDASPWTTTAPAGGAR